MDAQYRHLARTTHVPPQEGAKHSHNPAAAAEHPEEPQADTAPAAEDSDEGAAGNEYQDAEYQEEEEAAEDLGQGLAQAPEADPQSSLAFLLAAGTADGTPASLSAYGAALAASLLPALAGQAPSQSQSPESPPAGEQQQGLKQEQQQLAPAARPRTFLEELEADLETLGDGTAGAADGPAATCTTDPLYEPIAAASTHMLDVQEAAAAAIEDGSADAVVHLQAHRSGGSSSSPFQCPMDSWGSPPPPQQPLPPPPPHNGYTPMPGPGGVPCPPAGVQSMTCRRTRIRTSAGGVWSHEEERVEVELGSAAMPPLPPPMPYSTQLPPMPPYPGTAIPDTASSGMPYQGSAMPQCAPPQYTGVSVSTGVPAWAAAAAALPPPSSGLNGYQPRPVGGSTGGVPIWHGRSSAPAMLEEYDVDSQPRKQMRCGDRGVVSQGGDAGEADRVHSSSGVAVHSRRLGLSYSYGGYPAPYPPPGYAQMPPQAAMSDGGVYSHVAGPGPARPYAVPRMPPPPGYRGSVGHMGASVSYGGAPWPAPPPTTMPPSYPPPPTTYPPTYSMPYPPYYPPPPHVPYPIPYGHVQPSPYYGQPYPPYGSSMYGPPTQLHGGPPPAFGSGAVPLSLKAPDAGHGAPLPPTPGATACEPPMQPVYGSPPSRCSPHQQAQEHLQLQPPPVEQQQQQGPHPAQLQQHPQGHSPPAAPSQLPTEGHEQRPQAPVPAPLRLPGPAAHSGNARQPRNSMGGPAQRLSGGGALQPLQLSDLPPGFLAAGGANGGADDTISLSGLSDLGLLGSDAEDESMPNHHHSHHYNHPHHELQHGLSQQQHTLQQQGPHDPHPEAQHHAPPGAVQQLGRCPHTPRGAAAPGHQPDGRQQGFHALQQVGGCSNSGSFGGAPGTPAHDGIAQVFLAPRDPKCGGALGTPPHADADANEGLCMKLGGDSRQPYTPTRAGAHGYAAGDGGCGAGGGGTHKGRVGYPMTIHVMQEDLLPPHFRMSLGGASDGGCCPSAHSPIPSLLLDDIAEHGEPWPWGTAAAEQNQPQQHQYAAV